MTPADRARFWSKIAVVLDTDDPCWDWVASTFCETGYGQFQVAGRKRGAHRVMYELEHGPIPQGALVLHSCDRPVCVRPDHLSVGSAKDNAVDRHRKGRTGGLQARKLTPAVVDEIRRARADGARAADLAARYQISVRYARLVAAGARGDE